MKNMVIHDVVLQTENYDILSADTDFYASFIGKRMLDSFDRLIAEADREIFVQYMRERNLDKRFLLRLLRENGKEVYFFAQIQEGTAADNVRICLTDAERLIDLEYREGQELRRKDAILRLYGDTYFDYEPGEDIILLYSMEKRDQYVSVTPLDEFEEHLAGRADEKELREIHEFIRNMRGGMRELELRVNSNLMDDNDELRGTIMHGASIYEYGEFIKAVGFIHLGTEYEPMMGRRSELDSLTGLLSKAEITNFAIDMIDVQRIEGTTIAIVDIDNFKKVNDTFGHMCGDEVIKTVAAGLEKQVGDGGVVGRIGGDEFFVVFYDAYDMEYMRERMYSIKNEVHASYPQNGEGKPVITLSIGCAAYPKDADNYEDLFLLADFALYLAKEKGRDRYIIYDEAKHGDLETVKNTKTPGNRIDNRGDMSKGDILCIMMDQVYRGRHYPLQTLLEDLLINFGIQRIMVYAGTPYRVCHMVGEQQLSPELLAETENMIDEEIYDKNFDQHGLWFLNNIEYLRDREVKAYRMFGRQGILSFIKVRFVDKSGIPGILSLESVSRRITWDQFSMHYYRLFARLLGEYEVMEKMPETHA